MRKSSRTAAFYNRINSGSQHCVTEKEKNSNRASLFAESSVPKRGETEFRKEEGALGQLHRHHGAWHGPEDATEMKNVECRMYIYNFTFRPGITPW